MSENGIYIEKIPELRRPWLVAGFQGWGNALDVSTGVVEFLVRQFGADYFAGIDPDVFFRYDDSRPVVSVEDGTLASLSPPGGAFFAATIPDGDHDLVVLNAQEPNINWYRFTDGLKALVERLGIEMVVTLGSMYDSVHYADRIVSYIATDAGLIRESPRSGLRPVRYEGPSAIHGVILSELAEKDIPGLSLWAHCPYYIQGATHYGLMAEMAAVVADLAGFSIDAGELETAWNEVAEQIGELVKTNPKIREIVEEAERRTTSLRADPDQGNAAGQNVINIADFLEPDD